MSKEKNQIIEDFKNPIARMAVLTFIVVTTLIITGFIINSYE